MDRRKKKQIRQYLGVSETKKIKLWKYNPKKLKIKTKKKT